MDPQPYVNGYIYSDGQLAAGAGCVAPILEVTNRLKDPLQVSWMNRVWVGDDVLAGELTATGTAFSNHIDVEPGQLTLVANFFPSAGFYRSFLRLESAWTGIDIYIFNFSAEAGYYLVPIPKPCFFGACPCPMPPSNGQGCGKKELLQSSAFAGIFVGSQKPAWSGSIIFPVAVALSRQAPGSAPAGPCLLAA